MNLPRTNTKSGDTTQTPTLSPSQNPAISQYSQHLTASPPPMPLPQLPRTTPASQARHCHRLPPCPNMTLRRAPQQTTIWSFVTQQLQQHLPSPKTQQERPSQSTTTSSTQGTLQINSTPSEQLPELQTPNTTHQRQIHFGHTPPRGHHLSQEPQNPQNTMPKAANDGWGDILQFRNPQNHFQIISKNVSTLNPQSLDMVAIATELQTMQASMFLAQETNTAWTPTALNALQNQCRTVYPQHKLAVASSAEKAKGWFQPGGTCIMALGPWASRVIGWGTDELLGQWSFLELVGQNSKRAIIVSAYHVCKQEFDATTNTATAQQTRLLLQNGTTNPNPWQQFITDLIMQVQTWRRQGKEVLIGMDANKDVDNTKSHIS